MTKKLIAVCAACAAAIALVTGCSGSSSKPAASKSASPSRGGPGLQVKGNRLAAADGGTVRLLGVNRSGTEYACQQGWGIFDGPSSAASIATMKTWSINTVRVPLNEDCWLGINAEKMGSDGNGKHGYYAGARYQSAVKAYVQALENAGLYVVLDLHVAAGSGKVSTDIVPMADSDHAPDFWRSLGKDYGKDPLVAFDLYNEPHDVSWSCWRNGCTADDAGTKYRTAGMQELVDAVRSTGADRPLLLGGLQYSGDLSGWLANRPKDPQNGLVASYHTYQSDDPFYDTKCDGPCRTLLTTIAAQNPIVTGELGEHDCAHGYIDDYMKWADTKGISYLGWTWNAVSPGGWNCKDGPALITNYGGTPTGLGAGFKDHFLALRH